MKILVIGSGGREHALVWKLRKADANHQVYCAPGNAGIAGLATCVDIAAGDIPALLDFAQQENIELTIAGPEEPLTKGIVDAFREKGLRIFGPDKKAAILEGSKVFTKDFLKKYQIPSARYRAFSEIEAAKRYLDFLEFPCVIKADGLAAGKGVLIAATRAEAEQAINMMMRDKAFGAAGEQLVIEECLKGEEVSFLAFTDGKTVLPLPSSQDHKAAFDGDRGPNTGGMGAYSPAPVLNPELEQKVMDEIMLPVVRGMAAEGRPYSGILYAGLMVSDTAINVLEFNCRFGDPECQPLLMRLKTDLVDLCEHCIDGTLDQIQIEVDPRPAVCVVMAAEGYPGKYEKGRSISGLDQAAALERVEVFHAGTKNENGTLVTNGGRVLGVTAIGDTIQDAVKTAYSAVGLISWEGSWYRRDIAYRALCRLSPPTRTQVAIVMGSDSDLPVMKAAGEWLGSMDIGYELTITSAHRTPDQTALYAKSARERGIQVIIAGAGMAAHLAGVMAAHTTIPVIGVPLNASSLGGLDALLSTVQMPPGVPVATMGLGAPGAKNAAVLAARILALSDDKLRDRLETYAADMAAEVAAKNDKLHQ